MLDWFGLPGLCNWLTMGRLLEPGIPVLIFPIYFGVKSVGKEVKLRLPRLVCF